jgi:hypothetical protein
VQKVVKFTSPTKFGRSCDFTRKLWKKILNFGSPIIDYLKSEVPSLFFFTSKKLWSQQILSSIDKPLVDPNIKIFNKTSILYFENIKFEILGEIRTLSS